MDQDLKDDHLSEGGVNEDVPLRNTENNEGEKSNKCNYASFWFRQAILRNIWKRTMEKSQTDATNVT